MKPRITTQAVLFLLTQILVVNAGFALAAEDTPAPAFELIPCRFDHTLGKLVAPSVDVVPSADTDVAAPSGAVMTEAGPMVYLFSQGDSQETQTHRLGFGIRALGDNKLPTSKEVRLILDGTEIPNSQMSLSPACFTASGIRVALIFDRSQVMKQPGRLESLRTAAKILVEKLVPEDHVMVVGATQSGKPEIMKGWTSISTGRKLIQEAISKVKPVPFDLNKVESTQIWDATAAVIQSLSNEEAPKGSERSLCVLFTDADDADKDKSKYSLSALAELALKKKVSLLIVHPSKGKVNFKALRELAQLVDSNYYSAADADKMQYEFFREMALPHLGVQVDVSGLDVFADGRRHTFELLVESPTQSPTSFRGTYVVAIGNVASFWARILEIGIPVLLSLVVIGATVVIMISRRKKLNLEEVLASSVPEPSAVETPNSEGGMDEELSASVVESGPAETTDKNNY